MCVLAGICVFARVSFVAGSTSPLGFTSSVCVFACIRASCRGDWGLSPTIGVFAGFAVFKSLEFASPEIEFELSSRGLPIFYAGICIFDLRHRLELSSPAFTSSICVFAKICVFA